VAWWLSLSLGTQEGRAVCGVGEWVLDWGGNIVFTGLCREELSGQRNSHHVICHNGITKRAAVSAHGTSMSFPALSPYRSSPLSVGFPLPKRKVGSHTHTTRRDTARGASIARRKHRSPSWAGHRRSFSPPANLKIPLPAMGCHTARRTLPRHKRASHAIA